MSSNNNHIDKTLTITHIMIWELAVIATALLIIGLTGQGFEMRKMRHAEPTTQKVFLSKRNIKWYVIIGVAIILWTISERFS